MRRAKRIARLRCGSLHVQPRYVQRVGQLYAMLQKLWRRWCPHAQPHFNIVALHRSDRIAELWQRGMPDAQPDAQSDCGADAQSAYRGANAPAVERADHASCPAADRG